MDAKIQIEDARVGNNATMKSSKHGPNRVLDSRMDTSWVDESTGVDVIITLTFSFPSTVTGYTLVTGNATKTSSLQNFHSIL